MIKENCQLGCPCDNYECDLPDKMAVLALYNSGSNKNGSEKPSVLIKPNGKCIALYLDPKRLNRTSLRWDH